MKNPRGLFKRIGETLWLHLEGRTYTFSTKAEGTGITTNRRSSAKLEDGSMKSPMPGKILRINVKAGENVTPGQTVCVIEAMKMEYALKSPFEGKVKTIRKNDGEQVALDEAILEIEKGSTK